MSARGPHVAKKFHYYSHHDHHKVRSSPIERIGTHIVIPVLLILIATFLVTDALVLPNISLDIGQTLLALSASLARLWSAYLLCLILGVPLGLLVEKNRQVEGFMLPVYDVLQSIPVLAFFPVIILFFVRSNFLEGAAIFMLFFSMIWSIIFNTIGGLHLIPNDIKAVGHVFGLSKWERFTKITMPALFPSLVTGSILSLAAGWNIIIVAEGLHAYAPESANAQDLFGIGSVLVNAASSGDNSTLLGSMAVLVFVIAIVNLFLWQPMLRYSEKYKFDS